MRKEKNAWECNNRVYKKIKKENTWKDNDRVYEKYKKNKIHENTLIEYTKI